MLTACLLIISDKEVSAYAPQNAYGKQSRDNEDYSSTFGVGAVDMVLANERQEQAREASYFERE
jgi:hypothetical protein